MRFLRENKITIGLVVFGGLGVLFVASQLLQTPVPESRSEWVGRWVSERRSTLYIYEDGECSYHWEDGTGEVEVTGGRASWEDEKFYCSLLTAGAFEVQQAPMKRNGQRMMKLEGVWLEHGELANYGSPWAFW